MAAVAAGSGTPREEEGSSGEAAAPQPQASTSAPGPRLSRLPLARVKALVKADPDVTLAGQEAIFILARAAVRRQREGRKERGGERGEGAELSSGVRQSWGAEEGEALGRLSGGLGAAGPRPESEV